MSLSRPGCVSDDLSLRPGSVWKLSRRGDRVVVTSVPDLPDTLRFLTLPSKGGPDRRCQIGVAVGRSPDPAVLLSVFRTWRQGVVRLQMLRPSTRAWFVVEAHRSGGWMLTLTVKGQDWSRQDRLSASVSVLLSPSDSSDRWSAVASMLWDVWSGVASRSDVSELLEVLACQSLRSLNATCS